MTDAIRSTDPQSMAELIAAWDGLQPGSWDRHNMTFQEVLTARAKIIEKIIAKARFSGEPSVEPRLLDLLRGDQLRRLEGEFPEAHAAYLTLLQECADAILARNRWAEQCNLTSEREADLLSKLSRRSSSEPEGNDLYRLLVVRGYAQHEASYIAGGPYPADDLALFALSVLTNISDATPATHPTTFKVAQEYADAWRSRPSSTKADK